MIILLPMSSRKPISGTADQIMDVIIMAIEEYKESPTKELRDFIEKAVRELKKELRNENLDDIYMEE